jgi:hypothetical protein
MTSRPVSLLSSAREKRCREGDKGGRMVTAVPDGHSAWHTPPVRPRSRGSARQSVPCTPPSRQGNRTRAPNFRAWTEGGRLPPQADHPPTSADGVSPHSPAGRRPPGGRRTGPRRPRPVPPRHRPRRGLLRPGRAGRGRSRGPSGRSGRQGDLAPAGHPHQADSGRRCYRVTRQTRFTRHGNAGRDQEQALRPPGPTRQGGTARRAPDDRHRGCGGGGGRDAAPLPAVSVRPLAPPEPDWQLPGK